MRLFLPTCLLLLCVLESHAQNLTGSILDRKVSVSYTNEKVTVVLNRIAQQGGFSFSYNSTIISEDQVVTIDLNDKAVREVLNEIFKGSMNYKEKGNHLILTKVIVKQAKSPATSAMILSGYVEDVESKEKIVDASVYDKKTIASVVTDEFGFFRLKLERKEEEELSISVSKQGYRDTLIEIQQGGNQYLHIAMKPTLKITKTDTLIPVKIDSVVAEPEEEEKIAEPEREEELNLPYTSEPNVLNIRDTLYREFQASLIPFIGTNGALSGNVINNYSFNLFGGYSLGTRQVELGGLFNVDRGDVGWLQLAGFGNLVGGNVYGIQASGFFNINGGETTAVQATGFGNVSFKDFQGVQAAGFANVNLRSADGVLVAGFANYANGRSGGMQIAGFSNMHVGDYHGPQVAGFSNIATGKLYGSQISGFFNYAHDVHGTQIGFLNYADSLTGVPIGFLSIVRHGYHQIELSADEVFYTNLAFRSGARQFYNILFAGFKPENAIGKDNVWSFGYGLGTARKIARWLHLNIDLTSQHVNKSSFTDALSQLNKLHLGFDFRLAKKFSIYTGATLNAYLTKTTYSDYPVLFSDYTPNIFHSDTFSNDVNLQMWWGGKVALRFL